MDSDIENSVSAEIKYQQKKLLMLACSSMYRSFLKLREVDYPPPPSMGLLAK